LILESGEGRVREDRGEISSVFQSKRQMYMQIEHLRTITLLIITYHIENEFMGIFKNCLLMWKCPIT
jgi:hypothetical protein